jgi:hypothetical protein
MTTLLDDTKPMLAFLVSRSTFESNAFLEIAISQLEKKGIEKEDFSWEDIIYKR